METAVEPDVEGKLPDIRRVGQAGLAAIPRAALRAVLEKAIEDSRRETEAITAFANRI